MSSKDSIFSPVPPKKGTKGTKESKKLSFLFYEAMYGPIAFARATYRQGILLGGMFLIGAVIFVQYDKQPLLSALLGSISTITTIGLYVPNGGNFRTMPHIEAALLIAMIIVSVGAGASILQSTVNVVVNGDLARGEADRKMISRLKHHVIVLGYSHLGRYIAEKLDELGFDYVVLTRDSNIYHDLLRREIFAVLEVQARPMFALKEAGIEKADIVVVSHENDSDNMLVILSARKLRPDIRIIAVVHDENLIDTAKNAGADVVIPASVTVGHLLALSAVTKNLVGVVFSEKIGTKEIAQFSVFKKSTLIGKGMQEISKYATVIGVVRNDLVIRNIFDPAFSLKEDDTLLVLGDPAGLQTLEGEAKAL